MLVINPTLLSPPSSTLFPYTTLFRSYHHTTIGSMDDLNKATVEEVRSFFRTYYRPDNATLAIVGDLDRKSTRLNSSHRCISYAVFCLKKKSQDSISWVDTR